MITKRDKDKSYSAVAYAESHTVFVVHDGSKDFFASAPQHVRKTFKSTAHIREFTKSDSSAKVYAIMLQAYRSKGPYTYELSNVKLRQGFGRGTIKHVPSSDGTLADKKGFFGATSPPKSHGSGESNPDSKAQPEKLDEPTPPSQVASTVAAAPEPEQSQCTNEVTNAEPQSTKPVDESVGADEAEHVVDPPAAQPKSTDDVIVESGSLQNDHQSQSQDPPTSGSVSCIQLF